MLLSVALLSLLSAAPCPQLSAAEFTKRTEERILAGGVPGAALAVFKDGKVMYQQAAGFADVAKQTPYTTELAFEVGSLSKQFTAMALLMLVNEKKLALDAPLGTVLDELPEAWRAATVEQVMHHMSGIPDYEEIAGYDYYNEPHAAADVIRRAAEHQPHFKPGERFEYSNTGYYLLSLIVAKQSGLPFERFLATRIFEPLGMRSSYALERPADVQVATGYHGRTGTRVAQPPIAWSATLGAGGIVSTIADMLRWDEALYTERLLPAALRAKLWEPAKANDGRTIPYGAGWFTDETRGLAHLSHSGQTNGFSCYYLRFPEQHLSVLVHYNTYGGGIGSLARTAAAHFLPALNYASLPLARDEDPDLTAEHLAALRQAVLKEGELDLLGPGMRRFANEASFASERDPLRPLLESSRSFRLVREHPLGEGADAVEEFLYRQEHADGETFWTMRFAEGVLVSLNWEDE
ncbi:MAG: class A beta-lactamase-related serine hydrolase [Planctomycetes bacterium]|nr:class A beta-lactamase-related serine hydrolase [Planctomycetota bacterium]